MKRLEQVANVLIIITCLAILGVLAQRSGWIGGGGRPRTAAVGEEIAIPGHTGPSKRVTVLLALQTSCRFCAESAPFYRQLTSALSSRDDVETVAVLPDPSDQGRAYLDRMGVRVGQVVQSPLSGVKVAGTPTILLLDANRRLTRIWEGRLSPQREAEVLAALR